VKKQERPCFVSKYEKTLARKSLRGAALVVVALQWSCWIAENVMDEQVMG
jgi:hypothetical protein